MEIPSVGEEPARGVNADLCTEEPVFQGAGGPFLPRPPTSCY